MLRKSLLLLILGFCILPAISQNREFTVAVSPADSEGETLMYMYPLIPFASYSAVPMTKSETGEYSVQIPASDNDFYRIVMVRNGLQLFTNLYVPGKESARVEALIDEKNLLVKDTPDNMALSAYSSFSTVNAIRLWNTEPTDDATLKTILKHYISAADSIIAEYGCNPKVNEFIKLWAYTTAYNGVHSANRNAHRANHELSFKGRDILGDISDILDSNMSALFPETFSIIAEEMKNDTLIADKFEYLYGNYTNDSVRSYVGKMLLNRFLVSHNYETDFDGGLEQLQQIVEKYDYSPKYIADYNKRKAMIKGTPFPDNVVLRTAEGDTVSFSTFKGKYVYIDMWASWCGPCRKEIPHLQKLEKELQNEDVVFVSVSIDKDEKAWKDKMAFHNMHGHQFIDCDNSLGQALNVSGIPFFVIYDKEGRLYMHGAPRPSMGQPLKEMLEKLH